MSRHFAVVAALFAFTLPAAAGEPLPDTKPLTDEGDLAAKMVEGIGKYLDRETAASVEKRKQYWKPDYSSPEAFTKSVQPNRDRLKKMLGVVEERVPFTDLEYVGGPKTPSLVAETDDYKVFAVRWPVLPGVDGEGLLLEPKKKLVADVVAIPDADWTPEMAVGMAPGVGEFHQFPRWLAEHGCRVIVPVLIDRKDDWSGNPALGKMTNQPHREFLYRMGYEVGRHVIGCEVQKVLAAVDWFCRDKDHPKVGVVGYGEGGMLALYAGALDPRIQNTGVLAYFGPRESLWREPIYRNVFGLLREFGDAELAQLVDDPGIDAQASRRHLFIGDGQRPAVSGPPAPQAGAPGPRLAPSSSRNPPPWKPNTGESTRWASGPDTAGRTSPASSSAKSWLSSRRSSWAISSAAGMATRRSRPYPRRPPTSARISTPPSANTVSSINSSPACKGCCATPNAAARHRSGRSWTRPPWTNTRRPRSRSASSSTKT